MSTKISDNISDQIQSKIRQNFIPKCDNISNKIHNQIDSLGLLIVQPNWQTQNWQLQNWQNSDNISDKFTTKFTTFQIYVFGQ
jgi:hypothetical protein